MNRVVHFEIHAEDPNRAIAFYRDLFGWQINQWDDQAYWLVTTGPDAEPGINGAIFPRRGQIDGEAVIAYVCTIEVNDLDATLKSVAGHGGKQVVDTSHIPGVGRFAYCKDTEGNIFGLMQNERRPQ